MLFIHRMWFHESERIGKQKCTPADYALHTIADLLGFLGLLCLLTYLLYGASHGWSWKYLLIAFRIGIVSEVLFRVSWWLAMRRGFHYDDSIGESSWIEAGQKRTYKYRSE
jgi:hypothetical protein